MPVRNDRRRRVLADDLLNSVASEPGATGTRPLAAASGRRYARDAYHENQPRLVDYVPQRLLPLLVFIGLGISAIASLLAIYAWVPALSAFLPAGAMNAFDLASQHNLATWFVSLMFLVHLQLACMVYGIRKHRVDDYHGRYRIWLGVALVSLLASLQTTVPVGQLLDALLRPAAVWCGVAGHYGALTFSFLVLSYVCSRLLFEVRRSRLALVAYLFAFAALGYSQMPVDRIWTFEAPIQATLLARGLSLTGGLLLLLGAVLYSRHLMLDVEGKIVHRDKKKTAPSKPKRLRRAVDATSEEGSDDAKKFLDGPQKPKPHAPIRTDLDGPPRPAPLAKRVQDIKPVVSQSSSEDDDDDEDEESDLDLRNLSRVDRKRLKRQAKLAKRAQAA